MKGILTLLCCAILATITLQGYARASDGRCSAPKRNLKAKSESIVNDKGEKSYAIKCDYQLIHKGKLTQDWKHFVETGQFYRNWATAYNDIANKIEAILDADCEKRECNK